MFYARERSIGTVGRLATARRFSLYEAIRTHPGSSVRLAELGLTRTYYSYPLALAATAAQVPMAAIERALGLDTPAPQDDSAT